MTDYRIVCHTDRDEVIDRRELDDLTTSLEFTSDSPPRDDLVMDHPDSTRESIVTSVTQEHTAVGLYLSQLEVYGGDEGRVLRHMWEVIPDVLDRIVSFTEKDRMKIFNATLSYLPPWCVVLRDGIRRETRPNETRAQQIWDSIIDDRKPSSCYYNAQTIYERFRDELRYCEGIFLPKYGGLATSHAWVELDGHVIEVSCPWTGPIPEDAIYYGREVDDYSRRQSVRRGNQSLFKPTGL